MVVREIGRGRFHLGRRETPMYGLQNLAKVWNDESGISSVDYALLLAFVASGIMLASNILGNAFENEMTETAGCIADTSGCSLYAFPPSIFPR